MNNKEFKKGDKVFFLKKELELTGLDFSLSDENNRTVFPFNRVASGTVISCVPGGYTRVKTNGEDYYILTEFVSASKEEVEKEAKGLNESTLSRLRDFVDDIEKGYL